MADESAICLYVIDTSGLHELANSTSNSLRTLCIDLLSTGKMVVPVCVWKEFASLFEDEAKQMAAHVQSKIKMKKKYHIGAAAIADKCNPGFPLSPYDNKTDWYAASISTTEGWTLVTASSQLTGYQKLGCFNAIALHDLLN